MPTKEKPDVIISKITPEDIKEFNLLKIRSMDKTLIIHWFEEEKHKYVTYLLDSDNKII